MSATSIEILSEAEEHFCQMFVKTGIASLSARKSGFMKVDAGYRLLKKKRIKSRVLELKKQMQERVGEETLLAKYTPDVAMEEAEEALEFSRSTRNATAFAKTVEHRARLAGHLVEKIDLRAQVGFAINVIGIKREKPEEREALDVEAIVALPETIEQLELPILTEETVEVDYEPIEPDPDVFDDDERRKELFS